MELPLIKLILWNLFVLVAAIVLTRRLSATSLQLVKKRSLGVLLVSVFGLFAYLTLLGPTSDRSIHALPAFYVVMLIHIPTIFVIATTHARSLQRSRTQPT